MNEKLEAAKKIVDQSKYAMVGTISGKKYPNIRALSKIKQEGLSKFYFMTRANSKKVKQMKKNKKGCVYFYDEQTYQTVMLEGTFKIVPNTMMPIAEIYKLDPHDPFDFCTVIFDTESIYFYSNYETTRLEI